MRIALALASAGAVAAAATVAYGRGAAQGVPRGFHPETAAALGAHDLWVLGEYRCGSTRCQALVRSTDAGKHFTRAALPPLPSQGALPTLRFANARDGFAYVPFESPLYATHDGGSSWQRAGPTGHVVAFALGGGEAYVIARRVLERSRVGGNAWRKATVSVSRLPVSLAARGSNVWFLGPPRRRPDFDTIAISSDRGRTFATRRTGPCLSELGGTLVPAADGVVWAVCPSGMMAGLALSRNDGRSFSIRSFHDPGGAHRPVLTNGARIAPASPRVAVLSGGGGGPLLRTTDAGRRWSGVPRTGRIQEVFWLAFTTRRVGAAVMQTGPQTEQLWRTTDGGKSWRSVPIH